MCGICGTAGFTDRSLLEEMTSIISHRGPDDAGIYISSAAQIGLGNRRLSIIDLSPAGHMPMCNEDGRIWLTYNGEIYNFRDLRRDLEGRGHHFKSNTDSEVLIHGYEQWGLDMLARLNGMFAFALLDLRQSNRSPTLLLARDRFGIKPLYYTQVKERLLFASEIKALLLCQDVRRKMNLESLHRYMALRWVPGPETMLEGVYKLPPAHYLLWEDGRISSASYWEIRYEVDDHRSAADLAEELRTILASAVDRHMISDVPLGVFLSGGIDSSTILALASEKTRQPVSAYTIAFRPEDGRLEQSSDDPKYSRLAARHFGADYHEIVVQPAVADLLPQLVWHMDEPVADAAAISTYLICHAARPELKVLLSGQGADEIFAGYRVYLSQRLSAPLAKLPLWVREGPIRGALGLLPRLSEKRLGVHPGLLLAAHRFLDKLLRTASLSEEERYFLMHAYQTDLELSDFYSPELSAILAGSTAAARHLAHFGAIDHGDALTRMLYVDLKTFLPDLNLTYSDKMSSAVSVEVRVPFLDNEVVDFGARLHPSLKLRRLTSKYILKRAMKGVLPPEIISRRKAGFGAPLRNWLRGDLRPMVEELLSDHSVKSRGYFDPAAVRQMVEENRRGIADHSSRIWILLTLELWCRSFLDREPGLEKPYERGRHSVIMSPTAAASAS